MLELKLNSTMKHQSIVHLNDAQLELFITAQMKQRKDRLEKLFSL